MNHNTIFTVKNSDLERLDPHTAVDFFRKLLWAEARRIGVEISKINVSSAIHVADGGIDATVNDAQIDTGLGIIRPGKTSYQIKSGAVELWQPAVIEKVLFGNNTPDQQNLGKSIYDCLHPDVDGTYILVCTGIDCLVETRRTKAIDLIKSHLATCGYPNAKVDIWTQNTLIGYLESFPSLALWVTGKDAVKFQTHTSWSNDGEMRVNFVPGETQLKLIADIQKELRRDDDTVHVRVLGEPGIGKTRVALEATKPKDISPLVIYCTASQFRDSDLMNEILREDKKFSAVLIIDECDPSSRFYIWDKLRHRGSRIKLITIYNDHDPTSDLGISEFVTFRLDDEQIRTIIRGYNVPKDQVDRYVEFSGGSPRMAHHVGRTLGSDAGEPSQLLTDDYLYKRFYIDSGDSNSQEIQQRESVLQYIALFKRFGFERSVVTEAKAIAKKIEEHNSQINWNYFQRTVVDLKKRKILQGEFTLYLTPKALHIKLWTEWWKIHGNSFDLEEFTRDLPPKLIEWFYEMFVYAAESETASQIVKDLLGPNGPFQNDECLKTKLGSGFFLALTEANPKYALNCLSCTVGTWNRETLLQFKEGRREVILALEKIVLRRELFTDGASILLALGEAENESFSNNASATFIELFSPGIGQLAPTEASPSERFSVLKKAFESDSKEQRSLALKACSAALEPRSSSITYGTRYQGLREEPELWMPKTYGEIWDSYKGAWEILVNQLARLPDDESKECAMILLGRAREISRIPDLAEMVVETISAIVERRYVNYKHVIEIISQILRYNGDDMPAETRELWNQLMDKLVTPDFQSMMRRYVGMELLTDLQRDDDQNYADLAQPKIETLAQQAVETPSLLQSELDWLVTAEAKKGYDFGYHVAKRDNGFTLLSDLLEAQRRAGENASAYFLGGYLCALFETEPSLWEVQLDALIDDAKLRLLIPELTYRSGLTDRAGMRLLKLANGGIINVNHFGFFAYGKAIKRLSNEVFTDWITFLLGDSDKSSVALALNFFHTYHVFQKLKPCIPLELSFRLITHPALFKETGASRSDTTMTAYYWTEISKVFLALCPDKNLELAELMLYYFGEDGSIVSRYSQTCSVLDEITEKCPAKIWQKVGCLLANHEYSSKKFALEQWLREGSSWGREETKPALLHIPRELIWAWIGEDTEYRAWYFANRLVPKTLSATEWKGSLVRGLLIHYGDWEDVRNSLCANYMTETYYGPASLHYEEKKRKLLDIKKSEDDLNVRRWIDEFVESLKNQIDQEKIREEREH